MKFSPLCWRSLQAVILLTFASACPTQAAKPKQLPTSQTETFLVTSSTKVVIGANHSATLRDLKVGHQVSIGYVQENGARVARRVAEGAPHKPHQQSGSLTPKPHAHAGAPAMSHVHGILQVIDIQAGTMTITHKPR